MLYTIILINYWLCDNFCFGVNSVNYVKKNVKKKLIINVMLTDYTK